MKERTQAERITALEVQVGILVDELKETNKKLGDLVALRHKGAGVFWLFSSIFGASLIGVGSMVIGWFKG